MWLIASLILFAVLLLVAELVLLPGLSIAGIGALLANGAAVYFAFTRYGTTGGVIVLVVIVAISVAAIAVSLRAGTWQRFSLKQEIDGKAQYLPQEQDVRIGDRGTTLTRLAPMGKVEIGGKTFEAKAIDRMLDPRVAVEVTGFENFTVIVEEVQPEA